MNKDHQAERVQQLIDEIGVEEELDLDDDINISSGEELPETDKLPSQEVEAKTIRKTEFIPVPLDENTSNVQIQALLKNGDQLVLDLRRRPSCASCGYIPSEEEDPGHLTGECSVCGSQTCPQCKVECSACETILCKECTKGHGVMNEPYCSVCLDDVEEKLEFEREMEVRELEHEKEMDIRELEKKIKEAEMKMEQEELDNRFQRELEAEKLKLQAIKAKMQNDRKLRRQKLEELKTLKGGSNVPTVQASRIKKKGDRIKDHPHRRGSRK